MQIYSFAGNIFIHHVHTTEELSSDDGYDEDMDCISPLDGDQLRSTQIKQTVHSIFYKIGLCIFYLLRSFRIHLCTPHSF